MNLTEGQQRLHPLMGMFTIKGEDIKVYSWERFHKITWHVPWNNSQAAEFNFTNFITPAHIHMSATQVQQAELSSEKRKETWWGHSYWDQPRYIFSFIHRTGEKQRTCSKHMVLSPHQQWNACQMALIWSSVIALICTKWFNTCSLWEIPTVSHK